VGEMVALPPSALAGAPRSGISARVGAVKEGLAAAQENSPGGVEDSIASEEPVQQPEPAPPRRGGHCRICTSGGASASTYTWGT
jgi:hypothetical protein